LRAEKNRLQNGERCVGEAQSEVGRSEPSWLGPGQRPTKQAEKAKPKNKP
jgi:hypothetical protein